MDTSSTESPRTPTLDPGRGAQAAAFLLAQVGGLAAARFAERLAPLDLQPPHAGVLRLVAANPGVNQLAMAQMLGIYPSRLVALIDQLEKRGAVERRRNPEDRRNSALFLTADGQELLGDIGRAAMDHQNALLSALDGGERAQLAGLLARIAEAHGLTAGVHPGYRHL